MARLTMFVTLVLVSLATTAATTSGTSVINDPDRYLIEFRQFRPNSHYSPWDGPEEPMFAALESEAEWRDLWARIEPRLSRDMRQVDPHPFPPVNFEEHTLLVAALGSKPTGGYTVAIHSVSESPDEISVHVLALHPGDGCVVITIVTYPIALALIPKTTKRVVFDTTNAAVDCK